MKNTKLCLPAIMVSVFCTSQVEASERATLSEAIANGKTSLTFRYRMEHVDQDGFDEEALASTLKSRFTYSTSAYKGVSGVLEVDNVSSIGGQTFNSTDNGQLSYPVIADPEGTDINQAALMFNHSSLTFTLGRQRIIHGNQRFIGGVAWRQNEQTFDGYRLHWQPYEGLNVDYSYVYNVNRIFGPDGDAADLSGDFHLFNSEYALSPEQRISVHAYQFDFDTALSFSSRTVGVDYQGKWQELNIHFAYANQSDYGQNPNRYDADYYLFDIGTSFYGVDVNIGKELLGGDEQQGFSTPLATLHKFQGAADKFLATPKSGVDDRYIKLKYGLNGLAVAIAYHSYTADIGRHSFGDEWNVQAGYPLSKDISLLIKYSRYSADSHQSDTEKTWFQLVYKL